MEYINYLLITLGILIVCLIALRQPRAKNLARKSTRATQNHARNDPGETLRQHQLLKKQLKHVPTPWGWPGKGAGARRRYGSIEAEEVHDASETLHQWMERLKTRKVDRRSDEYRAHSKESLRSMLEDRYGRAQNPKPIRYEKVKPPLLRDPSEPHDQMDNFPSGKTAQIEEKLTTQPRPTRKNLPPMRHAQFGGIKKR